MPEIFQKMCYVGLHRFDYRTNGVGGRRTVGIFQMKRSREYEPGGVRSQKLYRCYSPAGGYEQPARYASAVAELGQQRLFGSGVESHALLAVAESLP